MFLAELHGDAATVTLHFNWQVRTPCWFAYYERHDKGMHMSLSRIAIQEADSRGRRARGKLSPLSSPPASTWPAGTRNLLHRPSEPTAVEEGSKANGGRREQTSILDAWTIFKVAFHITSGRAASKMWKGALDSQAGDVLIDSCRLALRKFCQNVLWTL